MKLLTTFLKFIWNQKLIFIIVFILVVGGFFYLFQRSNNNQIEYIEVKKGNIKSIISASGTLAGKNTANLKFKSSGRLSFINVHVGEIAKKGVSIAGLDARDLQIDLRQAELSYLSKKASAEKAEDSVKNHQSDENFTQKETRTLAQAAQNIAFDELKSAKLALESAFLISPIEGIVTQAPFLSGQHIATTDTIVQIVDWSQVFFDAEVDEADISRIQIGQLAEVTLNSYPDRLFKGVISEIIPTTKTTASGSTIVIVRVDLQNPNIHLIPGLNGQVAVIEQEITNVLVLPQDVLVDDSAVYKKVNNKHEKVNITTGLASDTEIAVTSGLAENDLVVKDPGLINK